VSTVLSGEKTCRCVSRQRPRRWTPCATCKSSRKCETRARHACVWDASRGRTQATTSPTPPHEVPPVHRTVTVALSLLTLSADRFVTAQAPPQGAAQAPVAQGDVRGRVVDTKSIAPIARASVSVRPKGGTTIVAGAIAGPDGAFRVTGLRP